MTRLDGRTALITGASRGQGAAAAQLFVTEGANVVITDVLEDAGRELAHELGRAATFMALDVTSEEQWATAINATIKHFGGLDVLMNNAGILRFSPLEQTPLADYQQLIDVNQTGVFLGMRAAAAVLPRGGSIINISSANGLIGMPACVAYCASKFAVRGMTKAAAIELAPRGIRVNSIHPGLVDTPMLDNPALAAVSFEDAIGPAIPLARPAAAHEIATAALFLASDESTYATGAEFVIDGGITAGINVSGNS